MSHEGDQTFVRNINKTEEGQGRQLGEKRARFKTMGVKYDEVETKWVEFRRRKDRSIAGVEESVAGSGYNETGKNRSVRGLLASKARLMKEEMLRQAGKQLVEKSARANRTASRVVASTTKLCEKTPKK